MLCKILNSRTKSSHNYLELYDSEYSNWKILDYIVFVEIQNILSWTGLTKISKFNSLFYTRPAKDQTICLRLLSNGLFNSRRFGALTTVQRSLFQCPVILLMKFFSQLTHHHPIPWCSSIPFSQFLLLLISSCPSAPPYRSHDINYFMNQTFCNWSDFFFCRW